jgi:hypothetical protein
MNRQAGHSRLTKSGFGNTQVVAESTTQSEKKSKGESVKDESASHGFVAGVFRREVGGGGRVCRAGGGTTDRDRCSSLSQQQHCAFPSDGQKAPGEDCQIPSGCWGGAISGRRSFEFFSTETGRQSQWLFAGNVG